MGFVHQIYGLKSERELALCISNEWVSAHSVGMQIDSANKSQLKSEGMSDATTAACFGQSRA